MKISTSIVSILLSLLLLFNSAFTTLNYAYYTLDPVGFIEVLCENKDQPELACNGQCHLKKVAQSQDPQQHTPESIVDYKTLILFSHSPEVSALHPEKYLNKRNYSVYKNLYSFAANYSFFHPPQV